MSVRCGQPLTYPRPADGVATAHVAKEVTARIWPCVQLQWEWLGGIAPIRTAAVIGAGSWGTAVAALLAGAGVSVQLGCRNAGQAAALSEQRRNERYLPGVALSDAVSATPLAELDLTGVDLVCLAVPSRALAEVIDGLADRLPEKTGVLVLSKGLVADGAQLPCEFVLARTGDRPVAFLAGPAHAAEAADGEAGLVVASNDAAFAARLERAFAKSGVDCDLNADLVGVQLASCAKNATALAAAVALDTGVNASGAAAGRVYAECHELARSRGAQADTFVGLAGVGDLVATVLASQSRNRRAGELLARGATAEAIEKDLGQAAEGLDLVPLLAFAMREAGIKAPATGELAELIESRRVRATSDPTRRKAERAGVA